MPLMAQHSCMAHCCVNDCNCSMATNCSAPKAPEIIKLARGEGDSQISKTTQCEQDTYEMQVRAANIVRAGESLMKLVSDIKQYLILNDFHSVNEAITNNSQLFRSKQMECDKKLMKLRDEMAMDLYDLEEEYYTSIFK
ncbi:mediator of RNA polymerase II transcription subunit 22 isoform X2 [Zeugodacus cucurbitae]|uniref:mediator of RNA polymerase II transcription subunit 22 isoform X2 n=1 Tax=Zeugodacus cucurbitae TaxID=28588 RepID=UPI0023D95486|nr:mediator of RNA polymerase II transcription subunit 22 isoform X2 [Zeugodacus cucurbitae]